MVMTSANVSELPIIYKNEEALEKLKDIADGYLMNNRDINVRCDDSLMSWMERNTLLEDQGDMYLFLLR
jgi:hydrogenase maturation protein HypF